ncbi:MAG TPA: ECF transporter S component, partial [Oscillospiraceae bacterium]|nr:ECF transporter S component [Oscillospiraceae bacterium]
MRISIRKLAVMAMLVAIGVVLCFLIHVPIIPAAAFLEYDPADIPILIGTFAFGPFAGVLMTAAVAVVQGVTVSSTSGLYGIVMHFIATGTYVIVAGNIYRHRKTKKSAVVALLCGTLAMTAIMV